VHGVGQIWIDSLEAGGEFHRPKSSNAAISEDLQDRFCGWLETV
jgi:hypothetical protein